MGIIARAIKAASGTINFLASSKAKSGEVNTDFNTVYTLVNGAIDNDNIASDAGIVDTKLDTIETAGKVSGSALTSLDLIPSEAGVIPSANLPSSTVNLTTGVVGVLHLANGGTSQTTAQLGINILTDVASATNEHVLTKDTATGNATFKAPQVTTVKTLLCGSLKNSIGSRYTAIGSIGGATFESATDVRGVRTYFPMAGTLKNLYASCADDSSEVTVYKNGSVTDLTVRPNNSAVLDSTHTVAISAGDYVSIKTGAGSVIVSYTLEFDPS